MQILNILTRNDDPGRISIQMAIHNVHYFGGEISEFGNWYGIKGSSMQFSNNGFSKSVSV